MSSNHGNNSHMPDQADLDRSAAREYEQQQKDLAKAFEVKKDKEGHARIFGFEVPESVAPALNMAVGTLLIPISKGISSFVYNQTKKIAESKSITEQLSHMGTNPSKVALIAELTAMWGIFAARPITEFVSANSRAAKDRFALSKEVKAVCEATGAHTTNNEVITAAYNELHQTWMDDLKLMIPSLLSVVPHAAYGMKMHHEISAKRSVDVQVSESFGKAAKNAPKLTEAQHRENLAIERGRALSALKKKEYEAYIRTHDLDANDKTFKEFSDRHWKSIESEIKESIAAGKDPKSSAGAKHDTQDMLNFTTFAGIASALGEGIGASMRKTQVQHAKQHTSWDLINKLKEQVQGKPNKQAVHKAVVEIFQQLEEDMGRTKFAAGLLDKLNESVEPISEYIASGRLDALALVKLAGESKVVAHDGSKRSFKSAEDIDKAVHEMLGAQIHQDNEMSAEQFLGGFANQLLAKETVKRNLATMTGDERDMFVSIMPTEILKEAGMTTHEISSCRRCAHEKLYDQVAAGILHVASQSPESLKELGVSEKEFKKIQEIGNKVASGDIEALQIIVDRRDDVMATVAAVQLGEQMEGQEKVWAERVGDAKDLGSVIDRIKAERAPKHHEKPHQEPHAEGHAPHAHQEPVSLAEKHKLKPRTHSEHATREDGSHLGQGA